VQKLPLLWRNCGQIRPTAKYAATGVAAMWITWRAETETFHVEHWRSRMFHVEHPDLSQPVGDEKYLFLRLG
jgi:hypothetical protein